MKNQQSGFTLIELIAVIVILGILAATALPKFVDMSAAAEQSAVSGVASNLSSAMALNYAAGVAAASGVAGAPTPATITNCTDGAGLLIGGLPPNVPNKKVWAITPAAIGGTLGTAVTCALTVTVSGTTYTANFQGISVPAAAAPATP